MDQLSSNEYLRERLKPQPGDPHYLCLSDLAIAIKGLIPSGVSRVLDYGCGGAPYRPLFGNCIYHRADLTGGSDLDFQFGPDAHLPSDLRDYDCVLSTQVLEHVEDPATYLRECYRVLRSGGHLILTTHGSFEDHACPDDYWRWTARGLEAMIKSAGLRVREVKKLTTGPRAALFLSEREFHRLRFGAGGAYGVFLSLGIRAIQRFGARRLHKASDKSFLRHRVVDAREPGHDLYIIIAALALRE